MRVSFIEKTLFTIHLGVAAVTKCPEFNLDKDDAKTLAEAVAGVAALYKIRMTPKQEAYGLLIEAAVQVYPPMLMSVYFRKKMEAEAARKNNPMQWPGGKKPAPPPTAQPGASTVQTPVQPPPRDFVQPTLQDGVPLQQEISDTAPKGEMPDGFDPGNISIPK